MKIDLKILLTTLTIMAFILVIAAFYVVFMADSGTYVVSSDLGPNSAIFSSSTQSSTPNGTPATASSSAASGGATQGSAPSSTASSTPTENSGSVSWTQGSETLSVIGATVSGSQLTLYTQVAMGSSAECVPLTIRLIADEQGDLSPPATQQFTFPDSGSCTGTAGETYAAQPIVFTLPAPDAFPAVFTTGGNANLLFEVDQNADGTLTVQPPPSAG